MRNSRTKLASKKEQYIQLAELEIRVLRSKRKSISLHIKPEGIILRAPLFSPNVMLKAFALSKINWLRKHHHRMQQDAQIAKRNYCDGETWLLFGEQVTLRILTGKKSTTEYNEDSKEIIITVGARVTQREAFIKQKLSNFYKTIALDYLHIHTPALAQEMNLSYEKIAVRDYKSRWGSCSSVGDLSFNWRIFMAPKAVIDSVIVHELAHLKHFNHSKQFWDLVFSICPNYTELHDWLKKYQYQLQA